MKFLDKEQIDVMIWIIFIVAIVFTIITIICLLDDKFSGDYDSYSKCINRCPTDNRNDFVSLECPKYCGTLLSCEENTSYINKANEVKDAV